jgi:hypothetical protein
VGALRERGYVLEIQPYRVDRIDSAHYSVSLIAEVIVVPEELLGWCFMKEF